MKLTIARTAAAITLAAAATFALPLAANADTYPSAGDATVSAPTVAPGGTFTFSVAPGTFVPGEPVSISLTGENASGATLAVVQAVVQTQNFAPVTATTAGGLSQAIKLPANASGTYTISATSPSLPAGVSASITIAGAGSLPATGVDSASLLGLWVGGGALVLAGGAVAVGAAVHRQRKMADA